MNHLHNAHVGAWRSQYRMPQSWQMLPALGLARGAHLPAAGMPARVINGVVTWVIGKNEAVQRGVFHRVRCACPTCGADVPAGRLAQHGIAHGVAPYDRARMTVD